jgi:uracil-DNA glycosylase family 4
VEARRPPATGGGDLDAERARRRALLRPIEEEVRGCRACVLCEGRTRTVFGVGDPCARLLFVGEGPGEDEDRQGEPFVGPAGQLLTRMIQAMGLARSEVYIANIVKCRPPGNRNPAPREIVSCLPYLRRQIEVVAPELICTLGNVATRTLLDTQVAISRLRGRFTEFHTEFQSIPVLPTFHPSYLLRSPEDKRLAWEDLRKIMERLGIPDPRGAREPPARKR